MGPRVHAVAVFAPRLRRCCRPPLAADSPRKPAGKSPGPMRSRSSCSASASVMIASRDHAHSPHRSSAHQRDSSCSCQSNGFTADEPQIAQQMSRPHRRRRLASASSDNGSRMHRRSRLRRSAMRAGWTCGSTMVHDMLPSLQSHHDIADSAHQLQRVAGALQQTRLEPRRGSGSPVSARSSRGSPDRLATSMVKTAQTVEEWTTDAEAELDSSADSPGARALRWHLFHIASRLRGAHDAFLEVRRGSRTAARAPRRGAAGRRGLCSPRARSMQRRAPWLNRDDPNDSVPPTVLGRSGNPPREPLGLWESFLTSKAQQRARKAICHIVAPPAPVRAGLSTRLIADRVVRGHEHSDFWPRTA